MGEKAKSIHKYNKPNIVVMTIVMMTNLCVVLILLQEEDY